MLAFASLLALLPVVALAQNASVCPPTVHDVQVGPGGKLVYVPNVVTAAVGDVVNFHYNPKNHSVISSAFATPCKADNNIFSGFLPTANGTNPNMFSLTVSAKTPIWIFCGQTNGAHCQKGMGMVINPPADPTKQITQYLAAAVNATTVEPTVAPGTGGSITKEATPNPACPGSLASVNGTTGSSSGSGSSTTGSGTTGSSSGSGSSTTGSGSTGNATVGSTPPVFTGAASTVGASLSGAAVLAIAAVALL